MHIKGRSVRIIRVDLNGFGADKCNYYSTYRSGLYSAFEEFTNYIKR